MTDMEIRAAVLQVLQEIAPEADLAELDASARIRDQLDIDSMDFLNFIIGLHKSLGVEIPERDYPKLTTLNDCTRYLTTSLQNK